MQPGESRRQRSRISWADADLILLGSVHRFSFIYASGRFYSWVCEGLFECVIHLERVCMVGDRESGWCYYV